MVPKRRMSQVLFSIWIVFTLIALLIPSPRPPKIFRRGFDKTVHTSLFFVMGGLGQVALPWSCFGITIPIAVGVEFLQGLMRTGREFEPADILSNLIGLFLGFILTEVVTRLKL